MFLSYIVPMGYIKFAFAWSCQKILNLFLPKDKRKSVILIDIPQHVLDILNSLAAAEGVTISEMVNKVLKV